SFCTHFNSDSTQTYITYEFLDADSNVLCTKSGVVQCNCMCSTAGANIAEGVPVIVVENSFTKVDYDSTKCCWEFSLKNNYSCTFKDDFYLEVIDYGTGATYTALTGWKDTLISGSHHFSSTSGGLKFNTTSKVFRVCVSPQFGTTPPPISVSFKEQNHDLPCRNFQSIPLQCVGEENCCDKLNIELKAYSHSFHDCAFDLFMSNKGTMNKCKVFGVRIISGEGDTLYTLSPQSTALDLDVKKQIWYLNKGECIPSPYTGLPQYRKEGYTIEILDSTGAVKCSVSDTIRCCSTEAIPKAAIQDPTPIPLSVGGMITEAKIEGNSLHYSIKNMGDDLSATIQLTDLKGNNIKKRTLNLTKGNSAGEFDISHLPNGTYFISVQTDLWQTSRQIVIQK
ncbi:MAG: T9SS type A sorting domain-containing protein, partial [Ignavibacteriae bacterium]|nr:T9SS type A sorting domain-containing protein [Ignavibacteriota bacterium]